MTEDAISEEMVDIVVDALYDCVDWQNHNLRDIARAALAASLPLIVARERANVAAVFAAWKKPSHMRLHAGEMTAQERRTVAAVLGAIERGIAAAIRAGNGGE